jgi:hypothetical protein
LHRYRAPFAVATMLLTALLVIACGGGSGGNEDPAEVLRATFDNEEQISSGVFELNLDVTAEGGTDAGTLEATLGGPFQGGDGKLPSFDVTGEAKLDSANQDFSGSAGLILTGDRAFVSFQDTDYEVPAAAVQQIAATFAQVSRQNQQESAQAGGNFLASIGIDPTNWLTDLSNEGTTDVEGTETIQISGQADVPKLVADIRKIAQNAPGAAQQVAPDQLDQLDQLGDVVESADFDIYTGADDDVLRKIEASIVLNPPGGGESATESLSLDLALTLSDLNEPQEISAPANAEPLDSLLGQFGVDAGSLGDLGSALEGAGGASGGSGGSPQAGGSAGGPSSSSSQAYLECLQTAQGQAALEACAALLGK